MFPSLPNKLPKPSKPPKKFLIMSSIWVSKNLVISKGSLNTLNWYLVLGCLLLYKPKALQAYQTTGSSQSKNTHICTTRYVNTIIPEIIDFAVVLVVVLPDWIPKAVPALLIVLNPTTSLSHTNYHPALPYLKISDEISG